MRNKKSFIHSFYVTTITHRQKWIKDNRIRQKPFERTNVRGRTDVNIQTLTKLKSGSAIVFPSQKLSPLPFKLKTLDEHKGNGL